MAFGHKGEIDSALAELSIGLRSFSQAIGEQCTLVVVPQSSNKEMCILRDDGELVFDRSTIIKDIISRSRR